MTTVYYPSELLTDSQISILTHTYCRWYNAWDMRDELHDVIKDKGQSKFYVYRYIWQMLPLDDATRNKYRGL